MKIIEDIGAFYLGKEVEKKGEISNIPFMLDSRDLLTHAVCLGMTGSGKTGLCVTLLEEAAIDKIPSIIIDPKGDMANLALALPDLDDKSFLPWIDEAKLKEGENAKELALKEALKWEKGLKDWGQDSNRIKKYKDSVEVDIYTPGADFGINLSVLSSFDPPSKSVFEDRDLYTQTLNNTVGALLSLIGIEADPLKSKEFIFLASTFDYIWKNRSSLDIPKLIRLIQKPPFQQVGVFDVEMFYPAKERMDLAMSLNNLLAAPGFDNWFKGHPLEINDLLYTPQGKPKISVISIAHLDGKERMSTVTLILNRLIAWMRSQRGTGSLRAIFYMDEIFGYLPPVNRPPSKKPLMTMLKQARAYGLGVVLATQNPIDLDYKALSNIGIWMIGRLQTAKDRQRLLEGLALNPNVGRGQDFDNYIASLNKRNFLMFNIHEPKPVLFHSRFALSYLRGPMTKTEISLLCKNKKNTETNIVAEELPKKDNIVSKPSPINTNINKSIPPVLPAGMQQYFLPFIKEGDDNISYLPGLLAVSSVYFNNNKLNVSLEKNIINILEAPSSFLEIDWNVAEMLNSDINNLQKFPADDISFYDLPDWIIQRKNYLKLGKGYKDWVYRTQELELFQSPSSGFVSEPEEAENEFRARLSQLNREKRDNAVEELREKYEKKINKLEKKINKAEIKIEKEKEQASSTTLNAFVSIGATILSAFMGRKLVSQSSIGRAATSLRRSRKISKEKEDVRLADLALQDLLEEKEVLEQKLQEEISELKEQYDPMTEELDKVLIKPKKTNINLKVLSLCWLPYKEESPGIFKKLWK